MSRVAFIIEPAIADRLKPQFKGIQDNLKYEFYTDVDTLVTTCVRRNIIYDRVIVKGNLISFNQVQDLLDFGNEFATITEFIIFNKKSQDGVADAEAKKIASHYISDSVTVLLMPSFTVTQVAELITSTVGDLKKRYGVNDGFELKEAEPVEIPTEPETEETDTPSEEAVSAPVTPSKKKGFFSSLFGGGKKKDTKSQVQPTSAQPIEEPKENSEDTENLQDYETEEVPEETPAEEYVEESSEYENFASETTDSEVENVEGAVGDTEPANLDLETTDTEGIDETISDDGAFAEGVTAEVDLLEEPEAEEPVSEGITEEPVSEGITEEPVSEGIAEEPVSEGITEEQQDDLSIMEDNLFDIDYTAKEPTPSVADIVDDADDDADNVLTNIAEADKTYREKNEAPKTIIKEVEKVVEVPSGKGSVIKSLTNGKNHAIVVVTGDRGSGVTSAARYIADRASAMKIDTLLVDFDIELHGLLNYLQSYEDFASSSVSIVNGLTTVRSVKNLPMTLYEEGKNLSILTSNYDTKVTDEHIMTVQEVVSESIEDFGLIVVDCPLDKLQYIPDLLTMGTICTCVEASRRGFMNMLIRYEGLDLKLKYKKRIATTGKMLITKVTRDVNVDRLLKGVNALYEPDDIDWMRMKYITFNGKLDISRILS